MTPLTARELAVAQAKQRLATAQLDSRQPLDRGRVIDNLLDHRLAVRDEIQRQEDGR